MGSRRCCCQLTCLIDYDDFNRSDASTLGSRWDESDDTWGISANQAYIAHKTGAQALAKFNTIHPSAAITGKLESMVVDVEIVQEVTNARYYLLVNWKDWSNYHIATYYASATGNIELGKVSGGTYTAYTNMNITGKAASTRRLFRALISPDEFCANVSHAVFSQVTCVPTIIKNGWYCGMGGDTPSSGLEAPDL
jgi:hypothetical protein